MDHKQVNAPVKRLAIFDGLKGVSILTIIGYYFFEHIVPGGFLAVNLFLFIAGFFNFRSLYSANVRGESLNVLNFYRLRFGRLFYPMLSMIAVTITYILLFARDYLFNIRNMAVSALFFFNNYYQIINNQSYFVQAANPSPFTHLWYVALYGQLILLVPIMIKLFYSWHKKPGTTANILLIISVLSAVLLGYLYKEGQDPTRIYYGLLTRASAFTFGGAVGLLYPVKLVPKPMNAKVKVLFNCLGLVAFVLAFFMVKFMYGTHAFAYQFGMTLFTLVSAILVMSSIHPATIWNKFFSLGIFTFFGKRSFSYYLWFYPVYLIVSRHLSFFNTNIYLNFLVQFLVIMILSEVTYRLFEIKQWSLPIGQDFNLKKSRYQFNYLRNNPNSLTGIKIATGSYVFVLIMGLVGVIASPEERSQTAQNLQDVIEANQTVAQQTQTLDTETVKVVNNIEGLTQQELLFANGLDISFIGDSVLLASTSEIQSVFPKAVVDGEVGRQLYNSFSVLESMKQNDLLKPTVVTMLGSNGTFTTAQLNDYIEAVGTDRDHYILTVHVNRAWTDDANRQIYAAAQRYGNVKLIDWAGYANDHPEWYADAGIHPNDVGGLELAKLIAKEIYRQR
ncbi:acyltransferase family protein [Fundicoccus sp. Sow4_D5]|uniref:acyltransferase family protein n=1 Tax=unclassified Fundicoccus TaxID=2761543 RepID=UPI003F91A50A